MPLVNWLWKNARTFDVLHVHGVFSCAPDAAAWIARKQRLPYILRPYGVLNRWGMQNRRPLLKKMVFRACERRNLEAAAAIHYTCEQERVEAEELGFHAPAAVVPNPVEIPPATEVRGRFRSLHPELAGKLIVLFLSRIDAKKGLDLLLPAFAQLRREHVNAALVIAGDGDRAVETQARRQAIELGIADSIVWTGFVQGQEKHDVLWDADIFALPSYSENFGVAAAEAMAHACPVVITDQVGIHQFVTVNAIGIVTPCRAENVARALGRLAGDASLRASMGARGRTVALSEFSTSAVVDRVLDLYRGALRTRHAAAYTHS